jgi:3-oxoacyl-ACP reductase-like protein
MSIFGKIFGGIFNRKKPAEAAPAPTAAPTTTAAAPAPTPPPEPVDVEAVLNELAAANPQKLNWRTSIVDLMKLVGLESSLAERKELADELGYTGDKSDTATMNIWLHKEVLAKLAANGGKVPADLLD